MLDAIKERGIQVFHPLRRHHRYHDIVIPEEKAGLIDSANNDITKIQKQYLNG
jgi:hypothetical protein